MQYIEFGKDKDKVSEIVMGLMRISEMSTGEVLDLIETGLEEGINFLDLADIYGGGKSEEVIGKVFTENPSLRTEFFYSVKMRNSVVIRILPISIFPEIIFWRL